VPLNLSTLADQVGTYLRCWHAPQSDCSACLRSRTVARRRHDGAGPGQGQNRYRAMLGLCPRRPSVWWRIPAVCASRARCAPSTAPTRPSQIAAKRSRDLRGHHRRLHHRLRRQPARRRRRPAARPLDRHVPRRRLGKDGITAFTRYGIECLQQIIADERAAGRATPQTKPPK
jgi:hypothetical protein